MACRRNGKPDSSATTCDNFAQSETSKGVVHERPHRVPYLARYRGAARRPDLARPVVARIATITVWPLVLIDLVTEEGVTGRAYLKPYVPKSMAYLVPALNDLGRLLKGKRLAPIEFYDQARKSLHFVGYEGLSAIAVAGLDMAAWDALARAAEVPLCVLLGGTTGPVRAYNSNGLWLQDPAAAAVAAEALELLDEGGFAGLKVRMGRDRIADDLKTLEAVRDVVSADMRLMWSTSTRGSAWTRPWNAAMPWTIKA